MDGMETNSAEVIATSDGNKTNNYSENKMSDEYRVKANIEMIAKGYHYLCVPTNSDMCAMYAKDMTMVGYILRDWPEVRFDVKRITPE